MSDDVRKSTAAVEEMGRDWPLIDALLGGTRTMREAGETFLPRWPNEEPDSFADRLKIATLFEAFKRTVEVLAAKPFSKPLKFGDKVPARIKGTETESGWADDIDLQGRNLHVFGGSICQEALSHGLSGILVEYPRADSIKTQAQEAAAGVRPYFVHLHPQQLLGWRSERKNGQWVLSQLRYVETVAEKDGDFGEKLIEQVRVLEPGSWRIFRKNDGGDWALGVDAEGNPMQGTTTLNKIPFVPVYGERLGFMRSRPPLVGLAHLNQKHWSEQSDQDKAVHYARIRLVAVIGMPDDREITLGSDYMIKLPTGGSIDVAQGSAEAVKVGQDQLDKIEDQMRQAGAELLVIKPGNTSIPQTIADNEPGKCALQRIAEGVEDAIDQALQLMAEWVGEKSGGNVELFKDFGAASLDQASGELVLKANLAGKLSDETAFNEFKRRGLISPDLNFEEEQTRIGDQPPPLGALPGKPPGDVKGDGLDE